VELVPGILRYTAEVIPKFLKKALKWQMKSGMLRVNKERLR
jgi:hypothetical protein